MADEEQFSLCWNNFNSNLSAGFHESLCRGDLVDVTLAAEGQLVKAHRLVLSVCSPYFRKMFTQMPANQHAFVFLKDVSHTALKDLIQFMYCGEVNVKQDALPTFISTAEALQIKGLTETGDSASTPAANTSASGGTAAQMATSPMKVSTPTPSVASSTATTTHTNTTNLTSPSRQQHHQQRSSARHTATRTAAAAAAAAYKMDSEESSDEKSTVQVVSQKRTVQRTLVPLSSPAPKRQRNEPQEAVEPTTTVVHVQAAPMQQQQQQQPQIVQVQVQQPIQQQQQQQQQHQQHQIITAALSVVDDKSIGEPEFIDMPIEIPTKAEPEYGDELGDVETIEQEAEHDMDQEHEHEHEQEHGEVEGEAEGEEDATYVEDETYGDMKYDESYFTENDDTKAGASGFSESYADAAAAETSGTEAQVKTEASQSTDYNLLPTLPITRAVDIQLFEMECCTSPEVLQQLRDKLYAIDYEDANRFLRGNLRALFTDMAAMPFSWFGQRGNIPIAEFQSIATLIDVCMERFKSTQLQCQKIVQSWFQYAGDRQRKRDCTDLRRILE